MPLSLAESVNRSRYVVNRKCVRNQARALTAKIPVCVPAMTPLCQQRLVGNTTILTDSFHLANGSRLQARFEIRPMICRIARIARKLNPCVAEFVRIQIRLSPRQEVSRLLLRYDKIPNEMMLNCSSEIRENSDPVESTPRSLTTSYGTARSPTGRRFTV
jgi:hypothetical protein